MHAKTHRGTWHEFRAAFVDSGSIDPGLAAAVQKVQPEREQADYDAWPASREDADRVIALATAFLAAIEVALARSGAPILDALRRDGISLGGTPLELASGVGQ